MFVGTVPATSAPRALGKLATGETKNQRTQQQQLQLAREWMVSIRGLSTLLGGNSHLRVVRPVAVARTRTGTSPLGTARLGGVQSHGECAKQSTVVQRQPSRGGRAGAQSHSSILVVRISTNLAPVEREQRTWSIVNTLYQRSRKMTTSTRPFPQLPIVGVCDATRGATTNFILSARNPTRHVMFLFCFLLPAVETRYGLV